MGISRFNQGRKTALLLLSILMIGVSGQVYGQEPDKEKKDVKKYLNVGKSMLKQGKDRFSVDKKNQKEKVATDKSENKLIETDQTQLFDHYIIDLKHPDLQNFEVSVMNGKLVHYYKAPSNVSKEASMNKEHLFNLRKYARKLSESEVDISKMDLRTLKDYLTEDAIEKYFCSESASCPTSQGHVIGTKFWGGSSNQFDANRAINEFKNSGIIEALQKCVNIGPIETQTINSITLPPYNFENEEYILNLEHFSGRSRNRLEGNRIYKLKMGATEAEEFYNALPSNKRLYSLYLPDSKEWLICSDALLKDELLRFKIEDSYEVYDSDDKQRKYIETIFEEEKYQAIRKEFMDMCNDPMKEPDLDKYDCTCLDEKFGVFILENIKGSNEILATSTNVFLEGGKKATNEELLTKYCEEGKKVCIGSPQYGYVVDEKGCGGRQLYNACELLSLLNEGRFTDIFIDHTILMRQYVYNEVEKRNIKGCDR